MAESGAKLSAATLGDAVAAAVAHHRRIRHHAARVVADNHPEAEGKIPDNGRAAGAPEPK